MLADFFIYVNKMSMERQRCMVELHVFISDVNSSFVESDNIFKYWKKMSFIFCVSHDVMATEAIPHTFKYSRCQRFLPFFKPRQSTKWHIKLWFFSIFKFPSCKYSSLWLMSHYNCDVTEQGVGRDAQQHTVRRYFHHTATIDASNFKGIENSYI